MRWELGERPQVLDSNLGGPILNSVMKKVDELVVLFP